MHKREYLYEDFRRLNEVRITNNQQKGAYLCL